jgi:hypothetical protein
MTYDEKMQAEAAYQNQASGVLMGADGQSITHAEAMRSQRIQSAIWNLTEARRIRNDPGLMGEIRQWVAEKRQEFMLLLDDIGQ